MKLIQYFFFGLLVKSVAESVNKFFKKNMIVLVEKEDVIEDQGHDLGPIDIKDLRPENYDNAMDLRGTPTHECVCGCNVFNLKVTFHEGQISQYFLDMECAQCGSWATAPTPIDNRNELD